MLFEFNFKIQYQFDTKNVKTDALSRKSDSRFEETEDERLKYNEQVFLTLDRLEIHVIDVNESIYDRVLRVNKNDEFCIFCKKALIDELIFFKDINLKNCFIVNDAFYRNKA